MALQEMLRDPKAMASYLHPEAEDGGSKSSDSFNNLVFLVYSKRSILHNNARYMDQLSANAKLPYASHHAPPIVPADPINKVVAPVFEQATFTGVENQAQNRLLLVTIALRGYFAERGAYPQLLNELAPKYLKKLPDDPLALNGTFRYRRDGKSYVLYSIGPDGMDDGGKMIDAPQESQSGNSNQRYRVAQDSIGDVVAGKNVW